MDFEDFLEFIEYLEEARNVVPRRYVRDAANPFEFYDNHQFKTRYRFSKEIIRDVLLPLVGDNLVKLSKRGLPISPILQLLIALRFYATGNFQVCCIYIP